jgi:CBS domain-containing protein
MKVRDIMTQPLQTCRLETDLGTASRRMRETGCGALAVIDARGRLAGIITDRDLALAIGDRMRIASHIAVRDAMSQRVYACAPDESVHEALARMAAHKVRRLPVVEDSGEIAGMLSIDDIVLWSVHKGGIGTIELTTALRSICAPRTLVTTPDVPEL